MWKTENYAIVKAADYHNLKEGQTYRVAGEISGARPGFYLEDQETGHQQAVMIKDIIFKGGRSI